MEKFDLIRQWAKEKGIYKSGDPKTQCVKLQEEAGELAKAILKNEQVSFNIWKHQGLFFQQQNTGLLTG